MRSMKSGCSTAGAVRRAGCLLVAVTTILTCLMGCQGDPNKKAAASSATSQEKQYPVHGTVVAVDTDHGVVSLDAQEILGYMEAMTMPYTLENPAVASELHPGDKINAQLKMTPDGARLGDIVILQQAVLDVKPTAQNHVPKAGDTVPNFKLLNQSGHTIHLQQFRGKTLVLTFIYTRCRSSQFCPLMSRNFANLNRMLSADPRLYEKTHLLSISFDPKYDTPAVLRSYGGAYTGRYTKETFQHWDFAAPSKAELASLLQWFDVGVTRAPGKDGAQGVLLHSVSTAVVGPDGKIRYWYPTNTWTPQQIFQDVQKVSGAGERNDGMKERGQ